MEIPLLKDIVIILGLSVVIILAFQRLKLPSIIGFLLTGIIIGPSGLSLISAIHEVELLAEIGVIFLLFVIGIEFSLKGLISIRRTVLGGGTLQVGGTILVTMGIAMATGMNWRQALFAGFIISLSSTAIVLKLLQSKGEISAGYGRTALAILIFQDIIVVPMMLIIPLITGEATDLPTAVLILLAKVIGVIVVVYLMARYLVPFVLNQVVKTRSNELFILTIMVTCLATAYLTSAVGLSLAIGAFFAGLIISESEYNHQAIADILPFREIFISFFFVSIGMLVDIDFLFSKLFLIGLLAFLVIIVKMLIIYGTAISLGKTNRSALLTGFSLFQVGEFSFILAEQGLGVGLISQEFYQYFLSVSILSMSLTPFVFNASPIMADYLVQIPLPKKMRMRLKAFRQSHIQEEQADDQDIKDHILIIGYGLNGKNLARAATESEIPYIIIEQNHELVQMAKSTGEKILYGDASKEIILRTAHAHEARVIVIAISDPEATKNIVRQVRKLTQTAYLIVRTRSTLEIDENLKLGADHVIPEEFETSIKIFTNVLRKYLVPKNEIKSFVNEIRSQNYELLRNADYTLIKSKGMELLSRPEIEIISLPVHQGVNAIVGKRIIDTNLKNRYGITVLAIKRGKKFITHIEPTEEILEDDILYVIGHPDKVEAFNEYLRMD